MTANFHISHTEQYKPDVIIMDVRLSGKSGIEETRQITKEQPKINVIMLSSYSEDELLFDAIRAGASGYMLKIVDANQRDDMGLYPAKRFSFLNCHRA